MMSYRRLLLRRDRWHAAVLVVSGNFALVMGTSLLLTFTGRIDYLLMLALSTAATIFTASGVKPSILGNWRFRSEWMTPIFLTTGGTILAAEAAILFIFFQGLIPAAYTVTSLTTCFLMLIGSDILVSTEMRNKPHPDLLRDENLIIERLRY